MKTLCPWMGMLVATALLLIVSWPMSAVAEEAEERDDKVRVAVMHFDNNSSWRYWGDNLGYAVADELVTQLFKTGKFSLVERTQLEAVLAEQNLGQSGRINSAQAAEIGRILGVQMILTGSITKFSVDTKGGGFGRFRAEYSEAESNLDIRLINTDTAEIMFADEGEGKVRLGGVRVKGINYRQEFDAGLAQEALRPAVEDVVQKIASHAGAFTSIQPPATPAEIVGVNGASFYIDKGENYGIVVGQRYEVHRVVDEIRDGGGNLLDTITDTVGVLEVTRVLGKSAICNVIEGDAAKGDSLRPTS